MSAPRVTAGLWVKAQLRLCDRAGLPLAVLRRGDADAGGVVLKILDADGRARVLAQATAPDGGLAWHWPLGPAAVEESEADAYIERAARYDPDLWVLEILDRDGLYVVDGVVLDEG